MTRTIANPHALASQVVQAVLLACGELQASEADRQLHRVCLGLSEWEVEQVRREVDFRLAAKGRG